MVMIKMASVGSLQETDTFSSGFLDEEKKHLSRQCSKIREEMEFGGFPVQPSFSDPNEGVKIKIYIRVKKVKARTSKRQNDFHITFFLFLPHPAFFLSIVIFGGNRTHQRHCFFLLVESTSVDNLCKT